MDERPGADDLAAIRRLMEESRRLLDYGSGHYIGWGILIAVGLMLTYGVIELGLPLETGWIWPVVIALGWLLSVGLGWRQAARAPVNVPAGRILASIWVGLGVALTLLGFLGVGRGAIESAGIPGVVSAVLGIGYLATGTVTGLPWLRYIAAAWWAGAVVMLWWPGGYALPLMAAMLLALQVAPGFVLRGRERRARHANGVA